MEIGIHRNTVKHWFDVLQSISGLVKSKFRKQISTNFALYFIWCSRSAENNVPVNFIELFIELSITVHT